MPWFGRIYLIYMIAMPQIRCTIAPMDAPIIIPRSFFPAALYRMADCAVRFRFRPRHVYGFSKLTFSTWKGPSSLLTPLLYLAVR